MTTASDFKHSLAIPMILPSGTPSTFLPQPRGARVVPATACVYNRQLFHTASTESLSAIATVTGTFLTSLPEPWSVPGKAFPPFPRTSCMPFFTREQPPSVSLPVGAYPFPSTVRAVHDVSTQVLSTPPAQPSTAHSMSVSPGGVQGGAPSACPVMPRAAIGSFPERGGWVSTVPASAYAEPPSSYPLGLDLANVLVTHQPLEAGNPPQDVAAFLQSFQLTIPDESLYDLETRSRLSSFKEVTQKRLAALVTPSDPSAIPTLIPDPEAPVPVPARSFTVYDLMQSAQPSPSESPSSPPLLASDNPWIHATPQRLLPILKLHTACFQKEGVDPNDHFGFLQKVVVTDPSEVVIRADVHGDLGRLCEDLRFYQSKGWLNERFQCAPNKHFIFVGDYSDRGDGGTKILLLLTLMREENIGHVHLLRGNHECMAVHKHFQKPGLDSPFNKLDPVLHELLQEKTSKKALAKFYFTMPLGLSIQFEGKSLDSMHAAPDLTLDDRPLREYPGSAILTLPRQRTLSERIKAIPSDSPLFPDAVRITQAVVIWQISCAYAYIMEPSRYDAKHTFPDQKDNLTPYCWSDLVNEGPPPPCGTLGGRHHKTRYPELWSYLRLMSPPGQETKVVVRGHQHKPQLAVSSASSDPLVFTLSYHKQPLRSAVPPHVTALHVTCGKETWSARQIQDPDYRMTDLVPL